LPAGPTFLVTTYETLESIREHLQALPVKAIIFDECSKIKNIESNRTKSAHALANGLPAARRILLSGTPSTTNPLGYFSLYELVQRGGTGFPSFFAWEKHFALSKLFLTVRLPNGRITSWEDTPETMLRIQEKSAKVLNRHRRNVAFKNHADVHAITQRHAYAVWKEEVLAELPPKIYQKRELEMTPEQRKIYEEIAESARTVLNNTPLSFTRSSPYMKLHQIANGYVLGEDKEPIFLQTQPKLTELEQLLAELGEQKLVVWSPFLAQIDQVSQFLAAKNVQAVTLIGETTAQQRTERIHAFQDPAGPQVLVANPSVGGLGLNLTCASTEVFMTNWFQPDVRNQAEDRLHRMGAPSTVTVIDLVTKGTLEVKILANTRNQISTESQILTMSTIYGEEQ
jgi:SNF2 family DNA or RNA helicase